MNLVPKTAAEKASKRVLAAARGQTGRRQMVPGMALGGDWGNPNNPAGQPPGLPVPPAMPPLGSPAWDAELVGGMAQGGERKMAPVRRGVWDGRKGGEVPEGPRGVDTVPALTQAGPVFLDSQPGAHEYVLTPEMTQALGGTKRLDALRQLMDNRDQVEARRTADGTGGPGLATAGPTDPGEQKKGNWVERLFVPQSVLGDIETRRNETEQRQAEINAQPVEKASLTPYSIGRGLRQAVGQTYGDALSGVGQAIGAAKDVGSGFATGLLGGEEPKAPITNPNTVLTTQASQPKPLYPTPAGPQTLAEAAGASPGDNVTLAGRYGNAQTPIYKNELMNPKDIATYGKAVFSDSTSGATKAGFDRDYAKGAIAATPGLTPEQASAQQIQFARDRARLSQLEALRGWQAQPEVSRLVSTPQNAGKPGHLPVLSYQTKAALPMWAQQELRTGAFEPQPAEPMPMAQQAQIEVAKLQGEANAEKARIETEGRANEAEINARKPLAPHYFTNPQTGETFEVYPGGTPRVLEALKSDPPFTSDFLAPMVEKLQPYAQAALSSDPEVAKNAMEQYKAQVKQLRKMAEGTGDSQVLDYYLKAKFDPRLSQ